MAQEELTTLPVGRLGLVPLESCRSLGQKVDEWLVKWRKAVSYTHLTLPTKA